MGGIAQGTREFACTVWRGGVLHPPKTHSLVFYPKHEAVSRVTLPGAPPLERQAHTPDAAPPRVSPRTRAPARQPWPMTRASSPSCSTRCEYFVRTIASSGLTMEEGGLRNITGSFGTSLPISAAWAA